MRTPPLTSCSSLPPSSSQGTSSGPTTPTKWHQGTRYARHAFDDSEDDDDESPRGGGFGLSKGKRPWQARQPLTPTRPSHRNYLPTSKPSPGTTPPTSSPSRFLISGTVTPSRALPLFTQFSKQRRRLLRRDRRSNIDDLPSEDEENTSPSKRSPKSSAKFLTGLESSPQQERLSIEGGHSSHFIRPTARAAAPPLLPIPSSSTQKHHFATSDIASYMHAVRSNNLGHMAHLRSTHGCAVNGSFGRGVLSAARSLGAGASSNAFFNVSQRSLYQSFQTTSTVFEDLWTLPSDSDDFPFSHPLAAEYANCSRALSTDKHQWLAVGSNEGRVFLLDTSSRSAMDEQRDNASIVNAPSWSAHDGSIFEVKWRFDDAQIATGGSDYRVRVWNTEGGQELACFDGHRGTPRSISWDPHGGGSLLASGGRDGGIHLFDVRMPSALNDQGDRCTPPVVSIWGAHTSESRKPLRGTRRSSGIHTKGITSLAYVPARGAHVLCSAGCADSTVKLWDLRSSSSPEQVNVMESEEEAKATANSVKTSLEQSVDVSSRSQRQGKSKSSHGISSLLVASSKIFAACTDGSIYTLSATSFLESDVYLKNGLPAAPLYNAAQRGNTLYARLALHDDERTLALGCNSGVITVWDTHVASLASSELISSGVNMQCDSPSSSVSQTVLDGLEADGRGHLFDLARPAILSGAHRSNFEINGISWAYGEHGPTLASISDDYTIRTWHSS